MTLSRKAAIAAGAKRYRGKPCAKGHGTERFICNSACVRCIYERRGRWPRKAKERARAQRRYLAKPEKRAAHAALVRKRRERTAMKYGRHAPALVLELHTRQRGRCANCRTKLGQAWDVDHVVPIALGGTDAKGNLQLLCRPCNRRKGKQHPISFAQLQGRLL